MTADHVEDELERLDRVIKAAEDWSEQYEKDQETFAGIIKVEARLERVLRKYFRGLAERSSSFVDWWEYEKKRASLQADALEVDVIIEDGPIDLEDSILVQAVYDPLAAAVALGANSGETVYQINMGLSETSAQVQRAARESVAELVGKKLDKDGNMIDNPKAKYQITDKTRKDIRESIRTSLTLGEVQEDAAARIAKTVGDPKRAATIARTEAVNAYQKGLLVMANSSGAVGKVWLSVNANDVCGTYAKLGIVKLDHDYNGFGMKSPAAHPNCRCSLRLVYAEELKR